MPYPQSFWDTKRAKREQGWQEEAGPASLCPHKKPRFRCWICSSPLRDELWEDYLEQYPNQRNEILRDGRKATP